MDNKKILIIEDDKAIRTFIVMSLIGENYICLEATKGTEGIDIFKKEKLDLILLDLGLPDIDGNDVLKYVRKESDVPIIVVSARGRDDEKVYALDLGADDYLTKPFSLNELLARIRVVLRRFNKETDGKKLSFFEINGLKIDFDKRIVTVDGNIVHLTPLEYNIIVLFAQNAGKVLTHKQIIKEIWNTFIEDDMHTLRVNMANIRKKIEKDSARPKYIVTEIGVGYRLLNEELLN